MYLWACLLKVHCFGGDTECDMTFSPTDNYDEAIETILAATERLFNSMGNAQEMVRQAKILAQATSSLVNAIKLEADSETDPDARRRLLAAAKNLADATAKLVEAAKVAARNPNDEQAQEALRRAAEDLRLGLIEPTEN